MRSCVDSLKKDKLIKSITKGEKEQLGPGGGVLKFNHYFIRYYMRNNMFEIIIYYYYITI